LKWGKRKEKKSRDVQAGGEERRTASATKDWATVFEAVGGRKSYSLLRERKEEGKDI